MPDTKDTPCPHCRGGYVYYPHQIEPDYCSSCNGTGIQGDPLAALLVLGVVRILTKAQNQERIRRPTKAVLDLAKACDLTPAEVMKLPADKIATYARLLDVANKINAGEHVPGVIICKRTGVAKRKKRR